MTWAVRDRVKSRKNIQKTLYTDYLIELLKKILLKNEGKKCFYCIGLRSTVYKVILCLKYCPYGVALWKTLKSKDPPIPSKNEGKNSCVLYWYLLYASGTYRKKI
jgi:hypothetical protein